MTRAQLAQCANETAADLFARVPMGKGYYERIEVAVETALNVQWWRGYYAAVDLALSLEEAAKNVLAEQEDDPTSLEALYATNRLKKVLQKMRDHSQEGLNVIDPGGADWRAGRTKSGDVM